MFKGYWIVAATLGIVVLTTEAWGQPASEDQPGQEESAANPNQNGEGQNGQAVGLAPALEGIEAAIRDLIAEEDKIAADAQESRESRDLEAQEGMAKWAEWMFYATAATVALTLAALFAIVRTLHHTRRAADYTEKMLRQAEQSTEAAFRAASSERAWLGRGDINSGPARDMKTINGIESGYAFEFYLTNYGRSPALNVLMSHHHIVSANEPERYEFPTEKPGPLASDVVPPNEGIGIPFIFINEKDTQRLIARTHSLYVFCECRYADVFGESERFTRLSLRATYFGDGHEKDGQKQQEFQFSAFGENTMS